LQKIWDLANDSLTTEEIKNNLLLTTISEGNTAWHLVAKSGNTDNLQSIWDFAKENLTTEEIKNNFLLAQAEKEIPPSTRHHSCGVIKGFWRKY
jgi:hypothetical protein